MVRLVPRAIVVGIEAGPDADGVLDAAFALAESVAARVVVVHVVDPDDLGGDALDVAVLRELVDASRQRVEARLPSDELLVVGSEPAAKLLDVAARELADLLVVGRGGHDGPTGGPGPVTAALLATADRPVLTVCGDAVRQVHERRAVALSR
jgi:nucleotide-binding universal stress UspA family protein